MIGELLVRFEGVWRSGVGSRFADERPGKERLDDFVLELVALFFVDLAALRGLDLFYFLHQCVADDTAGEDTFLFPSRDQVEAAAFVNEWGIFTLAQRRNEAVGGEFLAAAGASRLRLQRMSERFAIDPEIFREILCQAVKQQVREEHDSS